MEIQLSEGGYVSIVDTDHGTRIGLLHRDTPTAAEEGAWATLTRDEARAVARYLTEEY